MNPKVRSTLTDDFTQDRTCSICGQMTVHVVHLDAYPDYVSCDNCGAAFVVEDGGERVMYGKIPAQYSETRHFALQQWVWPEAIDRKAAPERPSGVPRPMAPPPPPPPEPEPPPAAETPDDKALMALPPEPEPDDNEVLTELPLGDEMSPEAGLAEEGEFTQPPADEAAEPEQAESPAWPPPPVEAGEPEPPESSTWPPPPVEAPETGDAKEDQQPPVEEFPIFEPSEAPDDVFASADEQLPMQEAPEDDSAAALDWDPEALSDSLIGGEVEPSQAEANLGDEEDLLDSLWGDEPYPTSEVATAKLPEPPAWATEIEPETEEPSPSDEAVPPQSDSEAAPAESDQDTADRLHTWGAPPPEEPGPPQPSFEDQGEAPEFPWDTPSDDVEEGQPPAVAPFEHKDWASDAFGLPDESVSEPSEPALIEEPPSEPPEPPAFQAPPSEVPPAIPTADAGDEAGSPPGDEPEETEDQAADRPAGPELEEGALEGMAQAYWGGAEGPPPPKVELSADEVDRAEPVHQEPPPGNRYRVVVKGVSVRYLEGICSHCLYSPASARLPILASVSRSGVGDRQIETLRIPVCADCKQRASARSEEQRTAQLQAHLIGVLVALVLIVCALSIGFINLRENLVPALVGLVVMAGLGYVVPAVPLLLRASRLPKPPDSDYVRSTLRVPGDTEGTETAFEWRNRDYARRFLQVNTKIAVSDVTRVREEGT